MKQKRGSILLHVYLKMINCHSDQYNQDNNTNGPFLENLKLTNTVIKRICNDGLSRTSEIQYNSSNFD
jgi:hypothetical protein